MGAPPDARALLAASSRVRSAVPLIIEAAEPGQRVALVGGVVRDLLRGAEPREIDVVVEGDGIAYARRLAGLTGAEVCSYESFGTATISSRPPVDVATARTERYASPGALPEVEWASLEQDLRRRDLTVNAIAIVVAGADTATVLDPFGGVFDIAQRRLRLLRPDSFEEDATRLVRVARYAVRLDAEPDATLVHAAHAAAHGGFVALTSPTRMFEALRLVFEEREPALVVALLTDWGVLGAIEPGLVGDTDRIRAAWAVIKDEALDTDRGALGLGLLAAKLDPVRAISWLTEGGLGRAGTRSALAVAQSIDLDRRLAGLTDADLDAACSPLPIEAVAATGGAEAVRYLGTLRHVVLAVNGDDVQREGGAEGPDVGRLLAELRHARIAGEVADDRAGQEAWLRTFGSS